MRFPVLSDHVSEIGLLAWLGSGVLAVLIIGAFRGNLAGSNAMDVAAFLLVLQRIVEAVQKRWEQRSVDRMGGEPREFAAGGASRNGATGMTRLLIATAIAGLICFGVLTSAAYWMAL